MKWKDYKPYLDMSYKVYEALYGKPNTHEEYANSFNIRGKIARVLIENNSL